MMKLNGPAHDERSCARRHSPEEPLGCVLSAGGLTQSEIELLRLFSIGMTNREIAAQLATTVPMVKWRAHLIFGKLQARNRVQAVARAREVAATAAFDAKLAAPGPMPESLRSVERRILEFLALGQTNPQIAASLGIKHGTVKWYMRELFGKLQVRNRLQALARARQRDWL